MELAGGVIVGFYATCMCTFQYYKLMVVQNLSCFVADGAKDETLVCSEGCCCTAVHTE